MNESQEHLDRLRRLRILQQLERTAPNPIGETGLLVGLRADPELEPSIDRVRRSLGYLYKHGLVSLIAAPDASVKWLAGQITDVGRDWLASPDDFGLEIYSPREMPEPSRDKRGKVSSVELLPGEVKAWIDQALARRDKTYQQLVDALTAQGYEISHSSMGRYGKRFREEQKSLRQSIEMAKAFAEVVGDDGAAMNQTLTVLAQQELMAVIREGRYEDGIKLPALVQSVAQLNRSDINTRKFQIEAAARKKALNDAANAVEQAAQQQGLSAEQAQFWRQQVLGVR